MSSGVGRPRGAGAGREAGQASVELLALFPLLLAAAVGVFAFLTAGTAREASAAAAQAGAMAILQDGDPAAAARRVLRAGDAGTARVQVRGRRVTVTVRPTRLGPLAGPLRASSAAEAGPEAPSAQTRTVVVRGGDGKGSR